MSIYTTKIVINKQRIDHDGKCPLVLQSFINGKRSRISIGERIRPNNFDIALQKVRIPDNKNVTDALNAKIESYLSKAKMIFIRHELDEVLLSKAKFESLIKNKTTLTKKLTEFIAERMEVYKSIKTEGTIKNYNKLKNKILDFRPNIELFDVDYKVLVEFEAFLKKQKLDTNTIWGYHKTLRFFLNEAIRLKLLFENPYINFKVKKKKTDRVFLNRKELMSLIKLYDENSLTPAKQEILRAFLFMCFTSIRLSDAKAIRSENVINNVLVFTVQKTANTKRIHRIDLSTMAQKFLIENKKGLLFNLPIDQVVNRSLKRIAQLAELDKVLTSHVARHSFATNFLASGGDIHVLQKIMDHEKIETTMVYVHILDEEPKKQIDVMSDLFI